MNNDYFQVKFEWSNLKKEFQELKEESEVFFKKPGTKRSGIAFRRKTKDIAKTSQKLKDNILRKRKDYQSDYS